MIDVSTKAKFDAAIIVRRPAFYHKQELPDGTIREKAIWERPTFDADGVPNGVQIEAEQTYVTEPGKTPKKSNYGIVEL